MKKKQQQPEGQEGRRGLRVAEIARAEFTRAVLRRIDDPRLQSLVVTGVTVSDDLSVIDIGVRFVGVEGATEQKRLQGLLQRALPRLVREILPRLELRRAPNIRLHYDAGADAAQRVEELLHEIQADGQNKPT